MKPETLLTLVLAGCVAEPDGPVADSGISMPEPTGTATPPEDTGALVDPLVRGTTTGAVRGIEDGEIHAFLGIPYAAPPVGPRRFRPPEPPAPWDDVRDTRAFGAPCVQPARSFLDDDAPADSVVGDEDCLTLNVWTPAVDGPARPVLVFVHGGGNTYGSALDPISALVDPLVDRPLYGGGRLAADAEVVVVTPQYRLGPLGYLSHPALDAESGGHSGNYGLRDLILALQWVRDNIAAFGGDPSRVLLMGQSGGGRDVNALWTCDTPPGLFSAAAIHSAPLGLDDPVALRERAQDLIVELGCAAAPEGEADCLRSRPPQDLVLAEAATPLGLASGAFIPTVDGALCIEQPRAAVIGGRAADVPVLLGTLDDEYSHRWTVPDAAYPAAVQAMVGPALADAVIAQYPIDRFGSATVAFTEMMSDRNVTCPHRRYARQIAASGGTVHHYRFVQILPEAVRRGYGAYHTTDILYLFRQMDGLAFEVTAEDVATQDAMTGYWTRFAATGTPSGAGARTWPPYDASDERTMLLGATPTLTEGLKADDCAFWDGLLGSGPVIVR